MAVSGSKNYSITRANIIESALRKLGVYDQGESIDGNETSAADMALNLMVKELVAEGADIFLRTESTLFLQPGTKSYSLGTSSSDHMTDSYVETTLSAAEAASQTVISVTSSTGMTASDYVGIKIDDDTIHWSTIASVDSSTQITINDATDGAAASGNKVYAYTTKSDRPQKILYAYRADKNGFDTEINIVGEFEYRSQSNKSADGPPVEIWYNPQGNQSTGKVWVWPDDGGADWDKLVFVCQLLPDDFDTAANNPDFPIEWGNTLVWKLAAELASEYGLPENEQGRLWRISEHKLENQLAYDVENADVIFAMDNRRGRYT